jgi:hypothetical protein
MNKLEQEHIREPRNIVRKKYWENILKIQNALIFKYLEEIRHRKYTDRLFTKR